MLFTINLNVYNTSASTILESEDTNFFSVQELPGTKNHIIISGLAMVSMLAVGSVTITFHEKSLCIYITMTKPKKWLRGDFSIPIIIPDNVNEIYFGNKKQLIWTRK
jgi:hypothetical protein